MRNIPDKLLASSTLISLGNSSGSGMMYTSEKYLYLITAKHVLYNENLDLRSEEIEIVCQTAEVSDESVVRFNLELKKMEVKFHKKRDVCVVKMGKVESKDKTTRIIYLDGATRLEKGLSNPTKSSRFGCLLLEETLISNEVYIFGYPTSLGLKTRPQFDYNKPLLRRGVIAGINKAQETIILDCPVYSGNSGGPVVQVTIDENGEKKFRAVGIISEYIPYVQEWFNGRDKLKNVEYLNSGYSVATSFDSVFELINSIETID